MENIIFCKDYKLIRDWLQVRFYMIKHFNFRSYLTNKKYFIFEANNNNLNIHIEINIKKIFPLKKVKYYIKKYGEILFQGKANIEDILGWVSFE